MYKIGRRGGGSKNCSLGQTPHAEQTDNAYELIIKLGIGLNC